MSDVYEGRNAAILQATIDGTPYTDPPQSRIEELLIELKAVIEAGGGGGGTTNYNGLSNKPQINSVTLQGNQSLEDLGINIPTVDSEISGTSENPVQNKVIKGALDGKENKLTFDATPTAGSNNPVTSGGVKTALDSKQDELTFDTTPTASSDNPVTSGGVKTAIDAVNDKLYSSIAGIAQNDKGSMELYSKNLNNIVTSGFYNAMTCTNCPFSYAALIVCGYYLTGYCFQMAVDIQTGEIKTRVQTGGTWGAWSETNNLIHG